MGKTLAEIHGNKISLGPSLLKRERYTWSQDNWFVPSSSPFEKGRVREGF
jgi:hypothetical protein